MEKVAVITGGEGDLGRAIAGALEEEGYEVRALGRDALDVTDGAAVKGFFEGLERVDLLVNNAGVIRDGLVARMGEEDWEEVMQVNLDGVFLCCRAALKLMCRQRAGERDARPGVGRRRAGGHVVNIGSYSALSGPMGQANYAAAKAGVIGLTKSLAKEVGGRGVRVNCVLPGYLKTKMSAAAGEEAEERALRDHVLKRFNTVAEAAAFIVFLDGMENVSGQVFQLDSRVGRWG